MNNFIKREIRDGSGIPLTLVAENGSDLGVFLKYYEDDKERFKDLLLKSGVILLRGAGIDASNKMQCAMQRMYPNAQRFLDGNSSRAKYTSNVYNASEYDSDSLIQLHTEFSYSNLWPEVICFCCEIRPDHGGQTTIGNTRTVLEFLDGQIVEEFSAKQITYIRNLHGGQGGGPSWMEAFETKDKKFVEEYCAVNGIECIWNKNNSGRFVQTRPALRRHPRTDDLLWFNQVDQFYPRLYGDDVYETLLSLAGGDPYNLPMYATFGDGSEIPKDYIVEIVNVLDRITVPVEWQVGDLLLVDNMLYLHGRLPFKGKRKILVSMA